MAQQRKQQARKPKRRLQKGGSLASDAVLQGITPAHMCRMYSALPEYQTPSECAIKAAAVPAPVESGSSLSHAAQSVASGVSEVAQGAVSAAQSAANAAEGAAQGVWNAVGGGKKKRRSPKKKQSGGEGCPFAKKPTLLGGNGCAVPVQAQAGGNGCAVQAPQVGGSNCSMHRVSSVLIGGKKEEHKEKKKGGNRRSRSRCLLCQSASCYHLKQENKQEGGADANCVVNAFRLEQNLPDAQYANLLNPDSGTGRYSVVMNGGKKKKAQKAKPKRKAAPKKKAAKKQ